MLVITSENLKIKIFNNEDIVQRMINDLKQVSYKNVIRICNKNSIKFKMI